MSFRPLIFAGQSVNNYSALSVDISANTPIQHDVLVEEYEGMRLMSFDGDRLQSAMAINSPYELAVAYTQRIMSFLLFHPAPQRIAMIGLGGGSLAKCIYCCRRRESAQIWRICAVLFMTFS